MSSQPLELGQLQIAPYQVGEGQISLSAGEVQKMSEIECERYGPDAWSRRQIEEELAGVPETRWYATARIADQVVGYVGLFLTPPDADVQTLTVAGDWTRRGIGARLLAVAIESARSLGCKHMFLEVRADNAAAVGLYRKFGFVRLGVRRNYYANGGDALNMRLGLSSTTIQDLAKRQEADNE
jgi:ribosomal-protein-alanine N-acetyltransferase